MKKVAITIALFALTTLFFSCKSEEKETEITSENTDLAIADSLKETIPEFLYVTAPSGLTLRQYNNLDSEKLAVMTYGTKVKIITPEANATMTVAGIKGGMDQVEFNHKSGFAFNGFLSKFFPPEEDIKPKMYAEELKFQFPKVTYTEASGGSASKPSNTQTLLLPTTLWHEAFYIGTELFDIPKSFAFPNPKGSNEEVVKENSPKKDTRTSVLTVNRKDNELQKITYGYQTEGYGYEVMITKEGDKMKIERVEAAN